MDNKEETSSLYFKRVFENSIDFWGDCLKYTHLGTRWNKISLELYLRSRSLQSCPTLCDPIDWSPPGFSGGPWDSPGKNIGGGCHGLLQGIFLIQGLNLCLLCLLHWQMGSLPLVPPGKPRVISTLIELTNKFVNLLANLLTFNVSEDGVANGLCDPRIVTVWRTGTMVV